MATQTDPSLTAEVRDLKPPSNVGNQVFRGLSTTAGWAILLTLAAVALFLIVRAAPAFTARAGDLAGVNILRGLDFWGFVTPLLFGTLLSSAIALLVAVPLSVGIALFISHYAPRRLAQAPGYIVDLLAAVPPVVFGLWGGAPAGAGSPR